MLDETLFASNNLNTEAFEDLDNNDLKAFKKGQNSEGLLEDTNGGLEGQLIPNDEPLSKEKELIIPVKKPPPPPPKKRNIIFRFFGWFNPIELVSKFDYSRRFFFF